MSFLFDGMGAPVLLLLSLFFAVTAVLWLLLPFSIFGIKAKLDEQLRLLRSIDARIERLQGDLAEQARRPPLAQPAMVDPTSAAMDAPPAAPTRETESAHEPRPSAPQYREKDERWQKRDGPE